MQSGIAIVMGYSNTRLHKKPWNFNSQSKKSKEPLHSYTPRLQQAARRKITTQSPPKSSDLLPIMLSVVMCMRMLNNAEARALLPLTVEISLACCLCSQTKKFSFAENLQKEITEWLPCRCHDLQSYALLYSWSVECISVKASCGRKSTLDNTKLLIMVSSLQGKIVDSYHLHPYSTGHR